MHGGTVEKFIGDEVMAVFGVPRVHDDDAERAVRAAFACRALLQQIALDGNLALEVRIGVNTGEVVADPAQVEQFLVTGTPVNVAARIRQAAAVGEILVGTLTRRLTRSAVEYGEARAFTAKNMGTLEAWPATRITSVLPQDHRGMEGRRAPLIGRDREMRLLHDAFVRVAKERSPTLVTIYGAAGSGKSRLIAEFTATVGRRSTLAGRCLPYGEGITLFPIQQILRTYVGIEPTDDRGQALAKLRAGLRALVGDDVECEALTARLAAILGLTPPEAALPSTPAADIADELRWGVLSFLEKAAAHGPLMVVFENLHWAESALLDLVEQLVETARAPLLIVCLARPEFRDMRPSWAARAANAVKLELAPLSSDDTRRLVSALLGSTAVPDSVPADLIARADGNPLYVEELLQMLLETEAADGFGGRDGLRADAGPLEIPATLQGLISARLDRVSPEVKTLLQRASLVGRLFSTDALEAIGGEPARADLLRDALRRDLLVESDERAPGEGSVYRFKHVLIREVTYATTTKRERARMHDNYGRWLERTFGDRRDEVAEIVAHHAEHAFLLSHELNRPEAADLGERALTLLNAVARQAWHRQDFAAVRLYERAAWVAGRFSSAPSARAEAIAGAAVNRYWRRGERQGLEEALELYEHVVATETGVATLLALAFASMADGRPDLYLPLLERAVAAAHQTGDANVVAEALGVRANGAYQSGDPKRYVQLIDEAVTYARTNEATRELPRLLILRHIMAIRQGEFTLAVELEQEITLRRRFSPVPTVEVGWLARQSALRLAVGDAEEALRIAERAVALAREHASRVSVGVQLWHLGDASFELCQWERTRDVLSEATDIFTALGQRGQIPEVAARCARGRLHLRDIDGARRDIESARAALLGSDRESCSITELATAELHAVLRNATAADAHFREAVAALDGSLFVIYLARARIAYAAFLIDEGRSVEAREQLHAARVLYSDPLAKRRRDEIDALLKRCDVVVRSR